MPPIGQIDFCAGVAICWLEPMKPPPIHCVVIGHGPDGTAIVTNDGALAIVAELSAIPDTVSHEIWCTRSGPAIWGNGDDPTVGPLSLPPPKDDCNRPPAALVAALAAGMVASAEACDWIVMR